MNKFLNILVVIVCLVSMMATAREGSFSSDAYGSTSSYSPSLSDYSSSSSSSSSLDWSSSSSSWDDDDDWGFSSSSYGRSNRSSNRSYGRASGKTTHCKNPFCPMNRSRAESHKFFLYELYDIPADQAVYYVNESGKATQEEKDLWTKTLCSNDHIYEKGKAPEQSDEIKAFIKTVAENKPAYLEYLQKKEAELRHSIKIFVMYILLPLFTLLGCSLVISFKAL